GGVGGSVTGAMDPEAASLTCSVPAGAGRAYRLALDASARIEAGAGVFCDPWHDNLRDALQIFGRAIAPYLDGTDALQLHTTLHRGFNIDGIISFSDAWPSYWASLGTLVGGAPAPPALDQQLFRGIHPHAE